MGPNPHQARAGQLKKSIPGEKVFLFRFASHRRNGWCANKLQACLELAQRRNVHNFLALGQVRSRFAGTRTAINDRYGGTRQHYAVT